MRNAIISGISLLAGGGDFLAGLALIVAPQTALAIMRVPPIHDWIWMRFIGCFVGAVGLLYFAGLFSWAWTGSANRLRAVWEVTIVFRVIVGGFVAVGVIGGHLAHPWLTVCVTDWTWSMVQAGFLARGMFAEIAHE